MWFSFHSRRTTCCWSASSLSACWVPHHARQPHKLLALRVERRAGGLRSRRSVLCGEDYGMVRYGERRLHGLANAQTCDRDGAKVRFRGGLLSVSASNFEFKKLHFCFVRAGVMPTTDSLANTCSRRSCAAFQAIAGLATVLQTRRLLGSPCLDPPEAGQSALLRSALVAVPKRRWAWVRCSNQHATQGLMGCCAKSALRYLRGTAPGTAQRCLK